MEHNIEQDISLPIIIAVFLVLLLGTRYLKRALRERHLRNQGQLEYDGKNIPSIEERVSRNKAWASGRIRSSGRALVAVLWTLTVVWNLTLGVAFIKSLSQPDAQLGQKIVLGFFAVGGLVAAYFAIRATLQRLRFGESWCCITNKAGVIGEKIEGKVLTTREVEAEGDYTIFLECLDLYHTGSGKNRTSKTKIHWQGKQTVASSGISSRAGIPFSFILPPYPPETGYQLARGTLNWQLRIEAAAKGVKYSAIFVVPVFKI